MKLYRSPFLRDFWHLNVAMMTSNNALIPDPDKEDILASKPADWPWLHLSQLLVVQRAGIWYIDGPISEHLGLLWRDVSFNMT